MNDGKAVRTWRITFDGAGKGAFMWFNPWLEVPMVRDLTDGERSVRLDRSVSVSVFDSNLDLFDDV